MILDFKNFKAAVAAQFQLMSKHQLFVVGIPKDDLWATYLGSFPEGTNPVFKVHTEHDCNCCKQFIRTLGGVVAVIDNKIVSIWDGKIKGEPAYQVVSDALSAKVKSGNIKDVFMHFEGTVGTDKNFSQLLGEPVQHNHFFVTIPRKYVMAGKDIASAIAVFRDARDVFYRGLSEITPESIEIVLDLISQNSLYRGAEYKTSITQFRSAQAKFKQLSEEQQKLFAWNESIALHGSVTKLRNTVIGTLLTDLSEGVDVDRAVGSFEAKVAPANYKRPTALVTKGMIEKAKETIEKLGLTSALDRRFAVLSDLTINNVLFADRTTRAALTGNVFDEIAPTALKKDTFSNVEQIGIEKFLSDVLPRATSIELLVENRHTANLVSLIAPVDPTCGQLFKWDNKFSWSYNGEFADSVKERVKKAGGSVVGELCCRLAWFNYDDLDLHMVEPNGDRVNFRSRGYTSKNGGKLDVDMNAGSGKTREAVENIFYSQIHKMQPGVYKLQVHNFSKRESIDVGFTVEIDILGTVHSFDYPSAVKDGEYVTVAELKVDKYGTIEIVKSIPGGNMSRSAWGVNTEQFVKVNSVMMSPNCWDDKVIGNKHYMFMLDGCVNDGSARGFFNEFLGEELTPHRKVLEMVGSKLKPAPASEQLSGVGFSSTQQNSVVVRVNGAMTRTMKIVF